MYIAATRYCANIFSRFTANISFLTSNIGPPTKIHSANTQPKSINDRAKLRHMSLNNIDIFLLYESFLLASISDTNPSVKSKLVKFMKDVKKNIT